MSAGRRVVHCPWRDALAPMQGNLPEADGGLLPRSLFTPLLPTPDQTLLLRFCLLDGDAAFEGWEAWRRRVDDVSILLRVSGKSVRGLNVLMLEALRRHRVPRTDTAFQVLRLSVLKETLRTAAYRRILGGTLESFRKAGIECLVLKGASVAETVYPQPVQRHCHGIELMVRDRDFCRAEEALHRLDFRPGTPAGPQHHRHASFVHKDGLPLKLRVVPLPLPGGESLADRFWEQSVPTTIAGVRARVPRPEDNLVHALTAILSPQRRKHLRWVADAWFLIHGTPEFDWEAFTRAARRGQLSLPSLAALDYLAGQLAADVPARVLETLAGASHGEPLARDNVLNALWATTRRDFRAVVWLLGGRRLRPCVLRWLFLPSREYRRFACGEASPRGAVLLFARRTWYFAVQHLRSGHVTRLRG